MAQGAFFRTPEEEEQYNRLAAQGAGLPMSTTATPTARAAEQALSGPASYGSGSYVGQGENQRRAATTAAGTSGRQGGAAKSGQHSMPFRTSNEWFGALDEYGGLAAAQDPYTMFDLYGTEVLGLRPGSATGQFYGENYNPYAMGTALGQDLNSPDQRLAAGTWMANQLGRPGMTFFDPAQIVTSVLSQIAQAGRQGPGGEFSQLAAIGQGDPRHQLENIVQFLGEALKGAMTPDVLGAYLGWIQQVGFEVINQVMTSRAAGGGLAEFEKNGGNIATALLSRIGANGGL